MTVDELVKELQLIVEVHPTSASATVTSRTAAGKKSTHLTVKLTSKDHVLLIEGASA
jgi:hypothetical protein